MRLEFSLDPDEQTVSAFYSFGVNRAAPKIGARSKYYKDWVRTNGGPPKHGDDMSPEIFVNPEIGFTVHVCDADKDSKGNRKDEALVYSRIDRILEVKRPSTQENMQVSWQAGSPF